MRGLVWFTLGVAAGLLLSPDSGDKNLQQAKKKLGEWGRDLEEQLTGDEEDEEEK